MSDDPDIVTEGAYDYFKSWSSVALGQTILNLQEFMAQSKEECSYTDDATYLQKFETQDVFVYGTLKQGFSSFGIIDEDVVQCLGVGYTANEHYRMYKTKGEAGTAQYPIALWTTDEHNRAAIYGEIYRVKTNAIFTMDYFESNGVLFHRIKVPVKILKHRDPEIYVKHWCWAYFGVVKHWTSERLNKFCEPLPRVHVKDKPNFKYYIYMKKYDRKKEDTTT